MAFRQSDTNGKILARYEDLLRATVDWEWETDAAGLLIGLSASVTSSLGRPPQSLLGRKLLGLAEAGSLQGEKSDRASVGTAELAACLSAHRTFRQLPVALLDAEDKAVSLPLNGVPYYAANGSFAGYRGTALRSSATILQSGESETNKRLLSLLEAALNRKDTDTLRLVAHRMKGSARQVGATLLADACEDFLQCAERDNLKLARRHLARIEDTWTQALRELLARDLLLN